MSGTGSAAYDPWAPYYDLGEGDRRSHLAFYGSLLRRGDTSVLEVACGTGVVAAALAATIRGRGATPRVMGTDISSAMLELARRRHPSLDWVQADMRERPPSGGFDLVVCCFNSLQFMHTDADLAQAFTAARGCVAADGRYAFDLYQPNLPYLRQARRDSLARTLQHEGRELQIREDSRFDEARGVLELDWRLVAADSPGEVLAATHFSLRQFDAGTVERLLAASGWRVLERYGDLARSAFTAESKKQVLVCAPA
jgi:SAM-dependent methyltransferase